MIRVSKKIWYLKYTEPADLVFPIHIQWNCRGDDTVGKSIQLACRRLGVRITAATDLSHLYMGYNVKFCGKIIGNVLNLFITKDRSN